MSVQLCYIYKMESKQASVKKLIRIHLNAHKKTSIHPPAQSLHSKNGNHSQKRKVVFKSPDVLIKLIHKDNKQNVRSTSSEDANPLPLPRKNILKNIHFQSQKRFVQTQLNPKSTSDLPSHPSPHHSDNKIKRIKSQQTVLLNSGTELLKKKMSKYKVMVKNPFGRKTSKSPTNQPFNQSKIWKNQSRISNNGQQDIANIISLL